MKTETINAVEMTRKIRDKNALPYWRDKTAYLKKVEEAAKQLKDLLSEHQAHSSYSQRIK